MSVCNYVVILREKEEIVERKRRTRKERETASMTNHETKRNRNEATRTCSVFNMISNLNTFDCSALNWKFELIVLQCLRSFFLLFDFMILACLSFFYINSFVKQWNRCDEEYKKNRNTHSCTDFKRKFNDLTRINALYTVPQTSHHSDTCMFCCFFFSTYMVN